MEQSGKAHPIAVRVDARERWTDTGLDVEEGRRYRLSVTSKHDWKDWHIDTGPGGYTKWWLRPFEFLRREPGAPWLALVAAVGRSESYVVGEGREIEPSTSGRLEVYPNDVDFMYWNNSGHLDLTIESLD